MACRNTPGCSAEPSSVRWWSGQEGRTVSAFRHERRQCGSRLPTAASEAFDGSRPPVREGNTSGDPAEKLARPFENDERAPAQRGAAGPATASAGCRPGSASHGKPFGQAVIPWMGREAGLRS